MCRNLIQGQVPPLQTASPISHGQLSSWTRRNPLLSARLPWSPWAWVLTCALWVTACPGAIDRAVPAEQACGVITFPALVDNGAGENQAIAEHDAGIAWSPGVPTGDH